MVKKVNAPQGKAADIPAEAVSKVEGWRTTDGQLFQTRQEAKRAVAYAHLHYFLVGSWNDDAPFDAEIIANVLLDNAAGVERILHWFLRNKRTAHP